MSDEWEKASPTMKRLVGLTLLGGMMPDLATDSVRAALLPQVELGGRDDPYPVLFDGDTIEIAPDGSWVVTRSLGEKP